MIDAVATASLLALSKPVKGRSPASRRICYSGGRLSEALGSSCEQMPPPFNPHTYHPLSLLPIAAPPPPIGKWRWVLLMSANPDYRAEAHQCVHSQTKTPILCVLIK